MEFYRTVTIYAIKNNLIGLTQHFSNLTPSPHSRPNTHILGSKGNCFLKSHGTLFLGRRWLCMKQINSLPQDTGSLFQCGCAHFSSCTAHLPPITHLHSGLQPFVMSCSLRQAPPQLFVFTYIYFNLLGKFFVLLSIKLIS